MKIAVALLLAATMARSETARVRFVGVYRLVSYHLHNADGRVTQPMTDKPVGRITYDNAGRMSALLMHPSRAKTSYTPESGGIRNASEADIRAVVAGFVAYHGRFDVDEKKKVVIHHVEAALHPAWVGTDLIRSYEFHGKRLTLRAKYPTSEGVLVWERQPD